MIASSNVDFGSSYHQFVVINKIKVVIAKKEWKKFGAWDCTRKSPYAVVSVYACGTSLKSQLSTSNMISIKNPRTAKTAMAKRKMTSTPLRNL
jgi:hypothetical protein